MRRCFLSRLQQMAVAQRYLENSLSLFPPQLLFGARFRIHRPLAVGWHGDPSRILWGLNLPCVFGEAVPDPSDYLVCGQPLPTTPRAGLGWAK